MVSLKSSTFLDSFAVKSNSEILFCLKLSVYSEHRGVANFQRTKC